MALWVAMRCGVICLCGGWFNELLLARGGAFASWLLEMFIAGRESRVQHAVEPAAFPDFLDWAIWVLLFGPASEQLTYGIIAPTAACATILCFREKSFRMGIVLTTLGLSLLSAGDVEGRACRLVPFGKSLLPMCVIVLFVWLAYRERNHMHVFLREMALQEKRSRNSIQQDG